jgi:hypothetical protein
MHMQSWRKSLRNALVSGSMASVTSTAALAACGGAETGSPFAATNAISHWYWGEPATRRDAPSWQHTAFGYATHHGASVFWAFLYETFFGARRARNTPAETLVDGMATAAVACFVDYQLTPPRLMPGYERRLSKPSLFAVYAAFGVGLAVGATVLNRASAATTLR